MKQPLAPLLSAREPIASECMEGVGDLFDSHYLHLVRIAATLVDDQATAEDVVQDVFAALQRRNRLRSQALRDPQRYLTVAVLNRSRSVLRHRRVVRQLSFDHLLPAESADASTIRRYDQERILAAVRRLPTRQREVVVLRYFNDLPISEIAETLSIRQSAVSASLHRAMATLKQRLGDPS